MDDIDLTRDLFVKNGTTDRACGLSIFGPHTTRPSRIKSIGESAIRKLFEPWYSWKRDLGNFFDFKPIGWDALSVYESYCNGHTCDRCGKAIYIWDVSPGLCEECNAIVSQATDFLSIFRPDLADVLV